MKIHRLTVYFLLFVVVVFLGWVITPAGIDLNWPFVMFVTSLIFLGIWLLLPPLYTLLSLDKNNVKIRYGIFFMIATIFTFFIYSLFLLEFVLKDLLSALLKG